MQGWKRVLRPQNRRDALPFSFETALRVEQADDDQDFSPEVDDAWEEEISRRLHAVKAGRARSRSIDEVFAELNRRFPS